MHEQTPQIAIQTQIPSMWLDVLVVLIGLYSIRLEHLYSRENLWE